MNKQLILIGNSVSNNLKTALFAETSASELPASIGHFDSGEPFVELFHGDSEHFAEHARFLKGKHVHVVQSNGPPVADNTEHLLFMVHTLKRYGVKEVTVMLPFAAFARQDREFEGRFVSVAADLFAKQLKAAGADNVVTITPHSQAAKQAYESEFGNHFQALTTTQLFAEHIATNAADLANVVVGAPDGADKPKDEGQLRAKALAEALFDGADDEAQCFKISKVHTGVSNTKITSFEGDVAGKECVVIDDMIDGGSTIINAASLLKERGAKSVTAYATHGILSGNALEKILSATSDGKAPVIDHLVVTDSLPEVEAKLEKLRDSKPELAERVSVLSTAPLLAASMLEEKARSRSFVEGLSVIEGGRSR